MIELKLNDWILNILGNSELSTSDFKAAGLNTENTSLLDEDIYKRSKLITENPEFQKEDGTFDESKFHEFYQAAQLSYNLLANDTYLEQMKDLQLKYGKDDIFAPVNLKRTLQDDIKYIRYNNPERVTTGMIRVGEVSEPKYSISEVAQTQKVLANPTTVKDDLSNAEWHDSPNDSWFTDFFDTRVLALWEEDGEHIDLITGEVKKHVKGEYKLNENGAPYYENLDGRDIYGKQVLNKMNTLTTDGTKWNKYDFFDSDDLKQKSVIGTVNKNLALVGSMFIPYVGPWVAGVSVMSQLVGLTGTLGKMLLGSESPTFSALEGWSKSVNRLTAKSQYASENTWCWENFISLIGDVAGQLKELRFLFEFAPALFKGNKVIDWNGISKVKLDKLIADRVKIHDELNDSKIKNLINIKKSKGEFLTPLELKEYSAIKALSQYFATKDVENFMKSYQKAGEILSKGYMTAITVGDTYGEAKYLGGASDFEATMLTLGYAAAELALLNSDIGQWILPELKASGLKTKAIIKALTNVPKLLKEGVNEALDKHTKLEIAKSWFKAGADAFSEVLSQSKGLGGQMLSGGLSEGIEETAEELLADFVKGTYNTLQWLSGNLDKRLNVFENVADRYLMSLLGGAVGGSLTAAGTNFKLSNYDGMTSLLATLELIYMLKEDKKDEVYRTLDKITVANKDLSLNPETINGVTTFKPASKDNPSIDAEIKSAFKQNVEYLDRILKAEGLKITDSLFLNTLILNDMRLAKLLNSSVSSLFLLDFMNISLTIFDILNRINHLQSKQTDNSKLTDLELLELLKLNEDLLNYRARKDSYLRGDLAMDYISMSLFDLSPIVSRHFNTMFFKDYAELKSKLKFELISESDLLKYKLEYDNYKANENKNDIATIAPIYLLMARNSGEFILQFALNYDNIRQNKSLLDLIKNKLKSQLALLYGVDENNVLLLNENDLDVWLLQVLNILQLDSFSTLLTLIKSKGNTLAVDTINQMLGLFQTLDKTNPNFLENEKNLKIQLAEFINSEIAKNIDLYYDEFIQTGGINPEIKTSLKTSIENANDYIKLVNKDIYLDTRYIIKELNNYFNNISESTKLFDLNNMIDNSFNAEEIYDVTLLGDMNSYLLRLNEIRLLFDLPTKPIYEYTFKDALETLDKIKELEYLILSKLKLVESMGYTDAISFILNHIQSNSNSNLKIDELFELVNDILNLNFTNLEEANLDGIYDQINEGIEVIDWLQGLVIGALSDSKGDLTNLIGYNITLNEIAKKHRVKDWIELPTITVDASNIINQDLDLLKNKLILAKNIYLINNGKKLSVLNKASINKDFITYNRLKKFIVSIGDEWAEKSKLLDALDNAEILKQRAEIRDLLNLNDLDKIKLEDERRLINDAVYEFFNNEDNKKLIDNGDLYKLFTSGFSFLGTSQLLDDKTEILEDRNFLYWLSSRASLKHSDFYNEFRQIIEFDGDKTVAPIPTLEEAVFLNIAEILNGDTTTKFMEAITKAFLKSFESRSDEDKINLLTSIYKYPKSRAEEIVKNNDFLNLDLMPIFSNIYLTEGSPGTGKSKAVDYYTAKYLKKFHKDIIDKAWLVHNTIENAESLAKEIDVKFNKLLDKKKLSELIFPTLDVTVDKNGIHHYKSDDWIRTSDNLVVPKLAPKDLNPDDIPSLIIIDEVSHYDLYELYLLNQFAKKHGITIITSGDFDLSSIISEIDNFENSGETWTIVPNRDLFKHSPKLGISMRSSNSQLIKTVNSYLAHLKDKNSPIDSYYYEDDKIGLNGVKHLKGGSKEKVEDIKKSIDKLFETAKEKVGYIYYNEGGEIYNYITSKYGDKIDKAKGNSALGKEGQYYIIDMAGHNSDLDLAEKDLYTGITRAQQGALVLNVRHDIKLNNTRELVTTESKYSEIGLKNYSKNRKSILDKIYTQGKTTYIPRAKQNILNNISNNQLSSVSPQSSQSIPTGNISWSDPNNLYIINYNNKLYITDGIKVAELVNNLVTLLDDSNPIVSQVIDLYNALTSNDEITRTNEITKEDENKENLEVNKGLTFLPNNLLDSDNQLHLTLFTYLLHSHNTFESGVKINDDKSIEFYDSNMKRYEYRIDSFIGLMKLYELDWKNPKLNSDFYTNKISLIRNVLFNVADKNDIIKMLNYIIDNNYDENTPNELDIQSLEFGLISSPYISKKLLDNGLEWGYSNDNAGKFGVFDKHKNETTIGNDASASNEINRKSINAVIKFRNGKRLTIPLFVLGNLETYTRNPSANPVALRMYNLYLKANANAYTFTLEILNDPELSKIPELVNIAKLFLFTKSGYFKIDDATWTPALNLTNYGILVNTSATGEYLPYDGTNKFNPITKFISSMPGIKVSSLIFGSLLKISDINGNLYDFANNGHPFILMTTDPLINSDEDMQKQYEKLITNPNEPKKVTLIYVIPPKVSMKSYLENLHTYYTETDKSKRINIKKLGSHLTPYYIWKSIFDSQDLTKSKLILDKIRPDALTRLKSEIDEIRKLEEEYNNSTDPKIKKNKLSEIVNKLITNSNWSGINTNFVNQSLSNQLAYLLFNIITDLNHDIIDTNVKLIEEASNILEIFYSAKFKEKLKSKNQILIPILSDLDINNHSLYTIDGIPFSINAKIDYNLFSADRGFNSIIESFVKKIYTDSNGRLLSADNYNFVNDINNNKEIISLDSNNTSYNELKITVSNDGFIEINGIKTSLTEDLKDKIYYNKQSILLMFNGTNLDPYTVSNLVNDIHNYQINNLIKGKVLDKQSYFDAVIKLFIEDENIRDNNIIYYYFNNELKTKVFKPEDLSRIKLSGLSIKESLFNPLFSTSGEFEVDLNLDTKLKIYNNGNVELINLPSNDDVDNTSEFIFENIDFSDVNNPNTTAFNTFLREIGIENNINEIINMYQLLNLSEYKGVDEFIEIFETSLDNINNEQYKDSINSIINYLKDEDSNECIIKIK